MFRPELVVAENHIERDHVVVFEHGGRLAGFVHLRPESHITLQLVSLFIDTWAIRQGVGQRLWNYAVAYAREQRVQAIVLGSDPNAEPFYVRQGAIVSGTHASELIPGRMLHVMTVTVGETRL